MIERKCRQCNTWNKEEDYCTNCGNAISPKALDKIKEEKRRAKEAAIPPTKSEIFMKKAKNHRFLLVRLTYHFLYSVGVLMSMIGAFLAWMLAMANA